MTGVCIFMGAIGLHAKLSANVISINRS